MIESIKLRNFISHKETELSLEDGVNVFMGVNGAGKSSAIDAITYALYGKHTRNEAKNLVRRGTLGGSVSVAFTVADRRYLAERRLDRDGKLESAVLHEQYNGSRIIVAGERKQFGESMSEEVSNIIGLDYEKMKVATIVQQGELDAIIKYQPKELKELINSLIGIDRLDKAFQNMREAIEGFRVRLRGECLNFDDRDTEKIEQRIQEVSMKKEKTGSDLLAVKQELGILREREKLLLSKIQALDPLRAKVKELEGRRKDLTGYVEKKVREFRTKVKELDEIITKADKYLVEVSKKSTIQREETILHRKEEALNKKNNILSNELGRFEALSTQVEIYESEISDRSKKKQQLHTEIIKIKLQIKKLSEIKKPTVESVEELSNKKKELEKEEINLREAKTRMIAKLEDYQHIKDEGVCPTCNTPLEYIDIDRKIATEQEEEEKASKRVEACAQSIKQVEDLIERRRVYDKAQEKLKELLDRLKEYADGTREENDKINSASNERKCALSKLKKVPMLKREKQKVDKELDELTLKKNAFQLTKNRLVEAISWLKDHIIASSDDVSQLIEEKKKLETKLGAIPVDISRVQIRLLEIDDYSKDVVEQIASLEIETKSFSEFEYNALRDELETTIRPEISKKVGKEGELTNANYEAETELGLFHDLFTRIENASLYVHFFEKVRSEVFNRDGVLATRLRSWALKQISRTASEYIRLFGIGLSAVDMKEEKREVMIECYGGSGIVDINSMSGGEKVAIALALRFAMASLMGKGKVDFIALDEPTAHLDVERRKSLVRLITELDLEEYATSIKQIIVITHDQEIFENSDVSAIFRFEKTIEGSTVRKS